MIDLSKVSAKTYMNVERIKKEDGGKSDKAIDTKKGYEELSAFINGCDNENDKEYMMGLKVEYEQNHMKKANDKARRPNEGTPRVPDEKVLLGDKKENKVEDKKTETDKNAPAAKTKKRDENNKKADKASKSTKNVNPKKAKQDEHHPVVNDKRPKNPPRAARPIVKDNSQRINNRGNGNTNIQAGGNVVITNNY